MATRDSAWPDGVPCWVDLGAEDVAQAGAFYSNLFGWRVEAGGPEVAGYSTCFSGARCVAGIGPNQGPSDAPMLWTVYLATSDLDATVRRVVDAGGAVLVEPMDVLETGRMAVAMDPGEAVFGIWQAGKLIGTGLANEPVSITWNENLSRDFEGNKAFYSAVFGYEYTDLSIDSMVYATFQIGGEDAGGIGELGPELPADTPAHWSVYFAVADTDATLAKAAELGGTVRRPAVDTPYGRMAEVADDAGTAFMVIAPSTA